MEREKFESRKLDFISNIDTSIGGIIIRILSSISLIIVLSILYPSNATINNSLENNIIYLIKIMSGLIIMAWGLIPIAIKGASSIIDIIIVVYSLIENIKNIKKKVKNNGMRNRHRRLQKE